MGTIQRAASPQNSKVTKSLLLIVLLIGVPVAVWAQWTTNSNDIYNSNSGNVGIGTTSPISKLHVNGDIVGTLVWIGGQDAAYYTQDRTGTSIGAFYRTGAVTRIWDDSAGDVMAFTSTGNVGIGTLNPSSKLHVVGDITVTGNINAKYQDIAEWVPSREAIGDGTVVVLEKGQSNSVIRSAVPYDTRVAGVISPMPGLLLGEAGEGKVKVATTGRVKVHVDASAGAIDVGDLLVTGTKAGTAMKSQAVSVGDVELHRPGTILGKALEALPEGEGEILVLLSLQ